MLAVDQANDRYRIQFDGDGGAGSTDGPIDFISDTDLMVRNGRGRGLGLEARRSYSGWRNGWRSGLRSGQGWGC